jgi:hypothetical protein
MTTAVEVVGRHDVALITLDTLRHDVAVEAMRAGETPTLASVLPGGWEERHTPGSFTYAAHRSFFAGFLPTPARPGPHPRPFALRFPGETTDPGTCRLEGADIVTGLMRKGYRTLCVGGVGFFNPATPLGADLTRPFEEACWEPAFGVSAARGFEAQIRCVEDRLGDADERLRFTFVNVSSLHSPNRHHLKGARHDSAATQRAALAYVDRHLGRLLRALASRRGCWVILCSDHGTAYGEDGYEGHRLAHPTVWTVPYGEVLLPPGWGA